MPDLISNTPNTPNRPERSAGQRVVAILCLLIGSVSTGYGIILLISGIRGAKNGDSLAVGLSILPLFFGISFVVLGFLLDKPRTKRNSITKIE